MKTTLLLSMLVSSAIGQNLIRNGTFDGFVDPVSGVSNYTSNSNPYPYWTNSSVGYGEDTLSYATIVNGMEIAQTFSASKAGNYNLSFDWAAKTDDWVNGGLTNEWSSDRGYSEYSYYMDGVQLGTLYRLATGSWSAFTNRSQSIFLSAGSHTLKFSSNHSYGMEYYCWFPGDDPYDTSGGGDGGDGGDGGSSFSSSSSDGGDGGDGGTYYSSAIPYTPTFALDNVSITALTPAPETSVSLLGVVSVLGLALRRKRA